MPDVTPYHLSYINLLATDDINASGKFMLEVLQIRIALNEHTVGAVDISSGGHCAINSYATYGSRHLLNKEEFLPLVCLLIILLILTLSILFRRNARVLLEIFTK